MSRIHDKADAARQLEAYFLRRVLSEAQTGFGGDGIAGSTFRDMFNEALADAMAKGRGVGLSHMIEKQLPDQGARSSEAVPGMPPVGGARIGRLEQGQRVYSSSVESLRGKVDGLAARTGIPAEFMMAWISHESGGNVKDTTDLNERGLFQIMGTHDGIPLEKTEAGSLGLSEADHRRLSTDVDFSLETGARLIQRYRDKAEATARAQGMAWNDTDMWRLTKFFHTGPAFVTQALAGFSAERGRAPASWGELYNQTTPALRARMDAPGQIGGVLSPTGLRRYAELSGFPK
ncbi:MAG TPA: rod-binding protein [Haliangiales bacterium]|nr:rod-binding protein [Haliangiales bacterium]